MDLDKLNKLKQQKVAAQKTAETLPAKKMVARKEKELLEQEKTYRKGVSSVLDLVAPSAFDVKPNFVKLGTKYARTLFVMTYPRYISVGWFAPIINYNSMLDVGMFFYPLESAVVLDQLKKKVGVLSAQLTADAEKGAPRDPLRETALRDIEKLRDDITQGVEKFFQASLYITLYADSVKELNKLTEDIEAVFGSKAVFTKRVLYQSEQGFNSTIPLGNDELMISSNLNSSPIAASFPFISADLTSDEGVMYGLNRHNNSLIIFDRFSLQNANMTVFATSGAGKSFAVKLEILRTMMLGTDFMVIDPEREYKHLCDAVGGTYVNISLNSDTKINPFDLPRPISEDFKTEDIIRSAIVTVKGLVRLMIGKVSYEEDSILDEALKATYAKKDITPDADLKKVEPPLMQDFYEVLQGMEGGASLALRLKKYVDGTFAQLFNAPTNVDINNQLVAFSVRDLEDELRPMAIYNIVNYIWNVVRSELKKRILVIDEAWWLLMHEDSAKFIHALVKRCRKYYLGVTTISQDVNDFLTSPYGKAIVTNSALNLLLKQSTAAIEMIQKTFMLTEGEKYLLLQAATGEGIFFAGQRHAAIGVAASPVEAKLITSDPKQLLAMEEESQEGQQERLESMEAETEETKNSASIQKGASKDDMDIG